MPARRAMATTVSATASPKKAPATGTTPVKAYSPGDRPAPAPADGAGDHRSTVGAYGAEGSLPAMADVTATRPVAPPDPGPPPAPAPTTGRCRRPTRSSPSSSPSATRPSFPLTTVARGLVYGLIAAILGMVALVLLIIGAVPRRQSSTCPGGSPTPGRSVWAR